MKKDSWLYSDSFLKRAFAIYGYNLVAGLIVAVCMWLIMAVFFIAIIAATGGSFFDKMQEKNDRYNESEHMEEVYDDEIDVSGSLLDVNPEDEVFE